MQHFFVGQKKELQMLGELFKKKSASLVVIRGRLRIGKSRLAQEFAKKTLHYAFSGLPPTSGITAADQKEEFARQLQREMKIPLPRSVMGGVPRYLEEILPNQSAETNIQKLCFRKEDFLFSEFERIFSDLFSSRSATYKTIVERLADGPCELKDIYTALKVGKNSLVSEYMEDLVTARFVSRDFTWHLKTGLDSKLNHYRLKDKYLRFYLKYIEPNKKKMEKQGLKLLPQWQSALSYISLQVNPQAIFNYMITSTIKNRERSYPINSIFTLGFGIASSSQKKRLLAFWTKHPKTLEILIFSMKSL